MKSFDLFLMAGEWLLTALILVHLALNVFTPASILFFTIVIAYVLIRLIYR